MTGTRWHGACPLLGNAEALALQTYGSLLVTHPIHVADKLWREVRHGDGLGTTLQKGWGQDPAFIPGPPWVHGPSSVGGCCIIVGMWMSGVLVLVGSSSGTAKDLGMGSRGA